MDITEVRDLGHQFDLAAGRVAAVRQSLDAALAGARWNGADASRFAHEWRSIHRSVLQRVADTLATEARLLQYEADEQEAASVAKPADGSSGAAAMASAGALAAVPQLARDREDRRIETDRETRTPEGGRSSGWLNNDWAGRELLERYLTGGSDWTITNDPDWTRYMSQNPELATQLETHNAALAGDALQQYRLGGSNMSFDRTFHMELRNGEGITGYEYLHGTNQDVGDFRSVGTASVEMVEGGYEVTLTNSYTWNDTIDPNPQYATDRLKSFIGEVATLGRADPYDLHITWSEVTKVMLGPDGQVLSIARGPQA